MTRLVQSLWNSRYQPNVLVAAATVGAALLVALALILWSFAHVRRTANALQSQQEALASSEQETQSLLALQADLSQREIRTRALLAKRVNGSADRVTWIEAVSASIDQVHPIGYSMEAGVATYGDLPDALRSWYDERGLTPPQFESINLTLKIQGVHEDELLGIVRAAERSGGGIVRTEHCKLLRRIDNIGLDVECTLRRYAVGSWSSQAAAVLEAS
jgi:uncharacterized protein YcfL